MITSIEWTATKMPNGTVIPGYTFNPWWGCVKVSPGCKFCYAETFDKRVGGDHWGSNKPRRTFDNKYWAQPLKWNKLAERLGVKLKVFCASMADWAEDNPSVYFERQRLFELIKSTPNLNWLLLTKRCDEMLASKLPIDWGNGYPNVWLGTSVENQQEAELRIKHLMRIPAVCRFISAEPLLSGLDITNKALNDAYSVPTKYTEFSGRKIGIEWTDPGDNFIGLDWVIVGGESGHNARPMHPVWAESLLKQCELNKHVKFFFKQWGQWQQGSNVINHKYVGKHIIMLSNGQYAEWNFKSKTPFKDQIILSKTYSEDDWNRLKPNVMAKVNKKVSGNLLDDRVYNNMPVKFDSII